MLSPSYVARLGLARQTQIQMMADRGHAISAAERACLTMTPSQVIQEATRHALARGCSLAECLGGTYVAGEATQGDPPETTIVAYVDMEFDDGKRRPKSSSTDKIKTILDSVRAARIRNLLIISPTSLTPDAKREILDAGVVIGAPLTSLPPSGTGAGAGRAGAGEGSVDSAAAAAAAAAAVAVAAAGGPGEDGGAGDDGTIRVRVMLVEELLLNPTRHVHVKPHRRLARDAAPAYLRRMNLIPSQLPEMPETDAIARYYDYRPGDVVQVNVGPGRVSVRAVVPDLGA